MNIDLTIYELYGFIDDFIVELEKKKPLPT